MPVYKIGQIVTCINVSELNSEGLVIGKNYLVVGMSSLRGEVVYALKDGDKLLYSIDRFKTYEEKVEDMINKPKESIKGKKIIEALKNLVEILETKEVEEIRPISKKQIGYIAGLTVKCGLDRHSLPDKLSPLPNYKELTEGEASELIDRLIAINNYLDFVMEEMKEKFR